MGITKPLVWINCPPGAEALDALDAAGLVYQRTDRYEDFDGVDRDLIAGYDRRLKSEADVTLFCASLLYENERDQCARARFIDHGADTDRFERAGRDPRDPHDVAPIGRPRVGFVGGIDAHTFWPEMFEEVVEAMPDVEFVMVGAKTLPDEWCDVAHAHFLGQKDYADVPQYMAACDVLVMPWNRSEWIKACNPIKLKEYLAVGRPIVTTSFHELQNYEGLVRVADNADAFVNAIRAALTEPFDPTPGRDRVRAARGERTLVTTLTKRMAEDLTDYYEKLGVKVRYLHSDIKTLERVKLVRDLRNGEYNVLIGINLLREGLDIPEVSLVAVLDADKEGFLRSERSLIQTCGRAARNVAGMVIMYADDITRSMQRTIDETNRRRSIQHHYNQEHEITPTTIISPVKDTIHQYLKELY